MEKGLISVIVPVYKAEAYLHKCVDSILAQTYTNLEVILVDDGSPDNCGAICDEYARQDSRVRVIHKDNGGQASARSAGLDIANGEFWAFVDDDDDIDADMYERMYERITDTDSDICVCGFKKIYKDYIQTVEVPFEKKVSSVQFWEALLADHSRCRMVYIDPWNRLHRTSLLSKVPAIDKEPDCSCILFYIDCLCAAEKGIVLTNFTPYNFRKTNQYSASRRPQVYTESKFSKHLHNVLLAMLPHKSEEINKIINYEQCTRMVWFVHRKHLNKQQTAQKITWHMVSTILRCSTSRYEQIAALLIYLLPPSLYRAAFKIYCKGTLK